MAKRKAYPDTSIVDDGQSDVIILVMGLTGAGKSTFINAVVGREAVTICHDLTSSSAPIRHAVLPHPRDNSRRIILVDTPGFDDTYRDDTDILKCIACWLSESYKNKKVTGIIYLHEITQPRTAHQTIQIIKNICGSRAYSNLALATTKWSYIGDRAKATERERLLSSAWKDMIDLGSTLHQFHDTSESGWNIIAAMLDKQPVYLQLDKARVDLQAKESRRQKKNSWFASLKGLWSSLFASR
ncbi:P-loop containing nucleoside triphosphate hydrolase protein [Hygrophoropsis aurantiaca]|uniref:P-loop containing nucleoside triphosphate hydrolase protein n=1 Tax=Hygrophoropsis aurantiaca TaxID=72124 RepID=A0ACB7ZVJ9_9AGAM|nr:P-loop containing nucleoside triphosphate hydrolase protein [Hygrophoropsis aurantiaca]